MKNKWAETGIPDRESLAKSMPEKELLIVSPRAVVECFQEIPCNPCTDACPRKAIKITGGINKIPSIDHSACNGCSICVYQCPGLAIFVVGLDREDTSKGFVSIPYEMLPLPAVNEVVDVLDREGAVIAQGKVLRVNKSKTTDKTAVVTIEIPSNLLDKARFFSPKRGCK
ncbi:4Fe-4S binding protein [candidate division WOR-3 bacterium]|nr:4Fe-4S binding protein [candidate division WOR-3 bacterium]